MVMVGKLVNILFYMPYPGHKSRRFRTHRMSRLHRLPRGELVRGDEHGTRVGPGLGVVGQI